MDKKEIAKLKKKYSLKNFLTPDQYELAKRRYVDVRVKPKVTLPDIQLNDNQFYNRIPSLKKGKIDIEFDQPMIDEYIRCRDDPVYFINAYVKIVHVDFGLVPFNLRAFQEDIVQVCSEFNKVILNTSRQVGKCVSNSTKIKVVTPKKGIVARLLFKGLMKLKTWLIKPNS